MRLAHEIGAALCALVSFTSLDALANPIDNPGTVTLDFPTGSSPFFTFASGDELNQSGDTITLDFDASGDGTFAYNGQTTAYRAVYPSR